MDYIIESGDAGLPLRTFLRKKGFSSHMLIEMKRGEEAFFLNGHPVHLNALLSAGDHLQIRLPQECSAEGLLPVGLDFGILYEDEDLLVIDKPAGMPCHPSPGNYDNTLANALARYFKEQGEPFTFRCINRLDRNTTGALIIARHALSGAILSQAMKRRQIRRTYEALVEGNTPVEGRIDLPIGRKPGSIIERCVDREAGERAETLFWTIGRYRGAAGSYSHIRLQLGTGRTHQIRVHMGAVGHPLLGDDLYNRGGMQGMKRQALHSVRLEFVHPITGQELRITSPLPKDMRALLDCAEDL